MFSISKWAAQTFLAPKTEVKDEAPASKAEMIDLTGDETPIDLTGDDPVDLTGDSDDEDVVDLTG